MSTHKEDGKFEFGPEPNQYDVLCGRGRECYGHTGNKTFRDIIDANLHPYAEAETKHERGAIVTGILDAIRARGGRGFLRFDSETQAWIELAEYEARQKIGQTIREVLTQRNPSKRAAYRDKQAVNKAKRANKAITDVDLDSQSEDGGQPDANIEEVTSVLQTALPSAATYAIQKELSSDTVPLPDKFDVLCGRGVDYYENPGNQLFRQLIDAALPNYVKAETKHSRSCIVSSLVDTIRRTSPNGFLRYCDEGVGWLKLDDYSARQKVGQTIREALTHRDPNKKAASRKRRAISKAKRSVKCFDDPGNEVEEMGNPVSDVPPSTDDDDVEKESHPLESILIAMTVQRQREHTPLKTNSCIDAPSVN